MKGDYIMKGDYGCRCNCCVYWRRHVYRVAGNRDRATRRVEAKLDWTETQLAKYKVGYNSSSLEVRQLQRENRQLKTRTGSLVKENNELKENLDKLPLSAWIFNKIKRLA